MSYASEVVAFSRVPQWVVELYMTGCDLSYTVGPCTAVDAGDGSRCSYSFPTCQDQANFDPVDRVFRFCLRDAPLPVAGQGYLPYLKEPIFIPQKIDPKSAITQNERVVLTFYDEPILGNFNADKLAGLTNTSTAGTFWRRFREIYRNYTDRRIVVRPCFGGAGLTAADIAAITPDFDGLISNIEMLDSGLFKITALDKRKRARKKIPAKISDINTIQAVLDTVATTIEVVDAGEFTDPAGLNMSADFLDTVETINPKIMLEVGWDTDRDLSGVCVFTEGSTVVTGIGTLFQTELVQGDYIWCQTDEELHAEMVVSTPSQIALNIQRAYGGRGGTFRGKTKASEFMWLMGVDLITNELTVVRGRFNSFYHRSFAVGTKIREVLALATLQPVDPQPLQVLDAYRIVLQHCAIPDADIDQAAIEAERDLWYTGTSECRGLWVVREQTEATEIIQKLSEIGMFSISVNGSGKITAKTYAPPLPSASLTTYDESIHFLAGSISVDDEDESSRLTRVTAGWDLMGDRDGDKPGHYHRALIRLNAASESANGFGDKKEKILLSKFLFRDQTNAAVAAVGRTLARFINGAKVLSFSLELKDSALALGDFFNATLSKIQSPTGANTTKTWQVTMRKRSGQNRYDYEAREAFNAHRAGFIGPNTMAATYDTRATADMPYAYIGDANNRVGAAKVDAFYVF